MEKPTTSGLLKRGTDITIRDSFAIYTDGVGHTPGPSRSIAFELFKISAIASGVRTEWRVERTDTGALQCVIEVPPAEMRAFRKRMLNEMPTHDHEFTRQSTT